MKTIKQLIFAFILFFAFTSTKAQIAIPTSSGKTKTPIKITNLTTDAEKTNVLAISKKPRQGQVIVNAKNKSEDYTKAEEVLTQEQKKQRDEDNAKANAKIEEMTNNRQRGY